MLRNFKQQIRDLYPTSIIFFLLTHAYLLQKFLQLLNKIVIKVELSMRHVLWQNQLTCRITNRLEQIGVFEGDYFVFFAMAEENWALDVFHMGSVVE